MPQKTVFPMKTSDVQIPPLSTMELSPQKKEKEFTIVEIVLDKIRKS